MRLSNRSADRVTAQHRYKILLGSMRSRGRRENDLRCNTYGPGWEHVGWRARTHGIRLPMSPRLPHLLPVRGRSRT
jgi:hypothetical protein